MLAPASSSHCSSSASASRLKQPPKETGGDRSEAERQIHSSHLRDDDSAAISSSLPSSSLGIGGDGRQLQEATVITTNTTRDLMVFGRENFATNPPMLRVLHQLYGRRRLRRIGVVSKSSVDQSLFAQRASAVVRSMLHHRQPLFQCDNFSVVEEAIHASYKRCNLLREWRFAENLFIGAAAETEAKTKIITFFKELWDLQHRQRNSSSDHHSTNRNVLSAKCLEAVRLLMVLRSVEALEGCLRSRTPDRPFYAELLARRNPKELMQQLGDGQMDQLDLALLADALHVRFEVFNGGETQAPANVAAVYPDKKLQRSFVGLPSLSRETTAAILRARVV